ncbi:helix-turn-helix transcriptional regulator [Chryseolinea lacunae]|uniref:AraC family transcriptional regulator n=1 Tax=Chryseolinea lacunae TaxID=2801331 RepID=A0ABS1KNQ8_9BACT|nr:helix-turn-helix transcriptional regulator [Chryseolinea lacunae]MBL0741084.1 AraC family transcriptional regulator [Chryseolinea lacunae]
MKYTQIPPPDYLKDFIQCFWTMEDDGTDPSPKTIGPLVDGCPGIIFQQAGDGNFYDKSGKQMPATFLYGQTLTRTELYVKGKFKWMGIRFYPNALKSVFRFNAHELTDQCLDLRLLPVTQQMPNRLLELPSTLDQVDLLSSHFITLIKRNNAIVDPVTHYAMSHIVQANGNVSLKELHTTLKLSERSFERKFEQHVGISAKLFSRICRFQASLKQLKTNQFTKLSDVAYQNGYADQSHFIRSFKEFAGYSPNEFQKQSDGSESFSL